MAIRIPDLLTAFSGEAVRSRADWEAFRRPEILDAFARYVYGVRPVERPADLRFERGGEAAVPGGDFTHEWVRACFGGFAFPFRVYRPAGPGPHPAFIAFMHGYQEATYDLDAEPNAPVVPVREIVARGYAVAVLPVCGLVRDQGDGFCDGVQRVFVTDASPETDASWQTIAAWAWGGSRVLDYLESDQRIDAGRVAVIGHSRGGKTALWCGATDERVALAVSSGSGCTGAALSRGTSGETIRQINEGFPHWFCRNYRRFNDHEAFLPVDQHMLLALMAPRPVYVASGSQDDWACPPGEREACRLAGAVYDLYGLPGLVLPGEPALDTPYHAGRIGYHLHEGPHRIAPFDWRLVMDFADRVL